jgi:hypothetical protein
MTFSSHSPLTLTLTSTYDPYLDLQVVVMDNDMVLLGNIDELAEHAEAPGMVWHTATVLARKERSAVTGGMFVLKPDAEEYARALHHLYHELNLRPTGGRGGGVNAGRRCYDGSDQAPGPACRHASPRLAGLRSRARFAVCS